MTTHPMRQFTFQLVTLLLFSAVAAADVKPIRAPNGGEIKPTVDGYMEVVNDRDLIRIYLYDKNLKPQKQLKDVSIVAEVQRATVKDHVNLELKPTAGGFAAKFDAGETLKFYLDIGIVNRKSGSADRLSFDVETASTSLPTVAN